MKTTNRVVAILCVLTLLLVMILSEFICGPGPDDLRRYNKEIHHPKYNHRLYDHEIKDLKTRDDVRAYLRHSPPADPDYYADVYEAANGPGAGKRDWRFTDHGNRRYDRPGSVMPLG